MRPSRELQPSVLRWSPGRFSAVSILVALAAGAAVFEAVCEFLNGGKLFAPHSLPQQWLALSAAGVSRGEWWRLVSYAFLHAGPFHLCLDILLLYFAAREVAAIIGGRRLIALYLASIVIGGLFQLAALPAQFAGSPRLIVGASAGVAAIIAAYATLLPELPITLLGALPAQFQLRTKFLGLAALAGAVVLAHFPQAASVGPVAILAGLLVGCTYMRLLGFGNPLPLQRRLYRRRQRAARLARMPAAQFICEEIDPILEKISRFGVRQLTRSDRKALERARQKITSKAPPR